MQSYSAAQQEQAAPRCEGKPYAVPYKVSCPYHAAAVERVLRDLIMAKAEQLMRLMVQRFAEKAPAASRLQLPAAAKALRAAAHDEAKKQGITSVGAGDEERGARPCASDPTALMPRSSLIMCPRWPMSP